MGPIKYIYCLEDAKDAVIDVITTCINLNNVKNTSILVGTADFKNPKLANIAKGMAQVDTEFVALIDSNVSIDANYLINAINAYYSKPNVGAVSAPPLATEAKNFWASIEASTLNAHQLRWQYVADFFGFGFMQGKNMIFKASIIPLIGGLRALDKNNTEDGSFTKELRKLNQKIVLMPPTEMRLGIRSFKDYWNRQIRWARLRRKTFLLEFLPEIMLGSIPLLILFFLQHITILPALSLIFIFYIPEIILSILLSVDVSPLYFLQGIIRDFLNVIIWFMAWGNTIEWRGKKLDVN
jgi:ceramide glucosyltransferase